MAAGAMIGHIDCGICGSERAQVRVSGRSNLVYVVCNRCNSQTFPRSDLSDQMVRQRMRPVPPQAAPEPQPNNHSEPKGKSGKPEPARETTAPAAPTAAPIDKWAWWEKRA